VVWHLQVSYFDHVPIFLTLQGNIANTRRKKTPKRFEEKWATHPECEPTIREAWSMTAPYGSPMFLLFSKIRTCYMALVAWSRNMGNSRSRIEEKQHQLKLLTAQNEAANLESI